MNICNPADDEHEREHTMSANNNQKSMSALLNEALEIELRRIVEKNKTISLLHVIVHGIKAGNIEFLQRALSSVEQLVNELEA